MIPDSEISVVIEGREDDGRVRSWSLDAWKGHETYPSIHASLEDFDGDGNEDKYGVTLHGNPDNSWAVGFDITHEDDTSHVQFSILQPEANVDIRYYDLNYDGIIDAYLRNDSYYILFDDTWYPTSPGIDNGVFEKRQEMLLNNENVLVIFSNAQWRIEPN